ncbi:MAG: mechanosensitive ion channel family protein [archaeon]
MDFAQIQQFIVHEFTDYLILNNTGLQWIIALCFFVILFAGLKIFKFFVVKRLKHLAQKTTNDIDDLVVEFIEEIHTPLYFYVALYTATRHLVLSAVIDKVMWYMLIFFGVLYLMIAVFKVIDYLVKKQVNKRADDDDTLIVVMGNIIKVMIGAVALLMILSNFGINIASLIAGLGVGGIAIAFALQRILEDIFSSFSIYFDKPFQVGDFITIGDDQGTVTKIGLKTTRIQHLKGHELIVSNRELTTSRIHNYKRLEKRRVVLNFGVEYSTPTTKLKRINDIVAKIIKKHKNLTFDRTHFKEFGISSLNFEAVYFINSSAYIDHADTLQEINFELKDAFEKEKIEFAYPTQTVILKK